MRRWASSAALLWAACTPEAGSDRTDAAEPTQVEDTGVDGTFAVDGVVLDLDGGPVVDVFVTVSTEFCIPDRTAPDGSFSVGRVARGDKRLITYGETAANGAHASVAFAFEASGPHTFAAPIRTPRFDEVYPIDPEATEPQGWTTADGLTLTIEPGALSLAPFAPETLLVARVPLADAPPFVPDGLVLLDLFVLHPILSTLDPPAPVQFPATTLPEGTPITFHTLDYDTGLLEIVARGAVDAAGRPTTDPGQGIDELTWVAISVE